MSERLTNRVAGWIEKALVQHDQGDEILWDVTMAVSQEQGPVLLIASTMRGAALDTVIHNTMVLNIPSKATEEGVEQMVLVMLDALRQERSRQLGMMNGGGQVPGQIPGQIPGQPPRPVPPGPFPGRFQMPHPPG